MNLNELDIICENYPWKNLEHDLVEILIHIIENYENGNSAIFKELYRHIDINSDFKQEEKKIVNNKLSKLNSLGLIYSTNTYIDNRTVHISNKLKSKLYSKFPNEVKFYNDTQIDIYIDIDNIIKENLEIIGTFSNAKYFRLKNNTKYKIKIVDLKSQCKIVIEEIGLNENCIISKLENTNLKALELLERENNKLRKKLESIEQKLKDCENIKLQNQETIDFHKEKIKTLESQLSNNVDKSKTVK